MLERDPIQLHDGLRGKINPAYRMDEATIMNQLLSHAEFSSDMVEQIRSCAIDLVETVRAERKKTSGIDSFLTQYSLSSDEGIALMCLAEALLRVPDNPTVNALIKDKLSAADWKAHQGKSSSFFVNATTWALMLTGKVLNPESSESTLSKAAWFALRWIKPCAL